MAAILLVDDDTDTWSAVKLALEPQVQVHIVYSLAGTLDFLRTRSHEVSGVIVDIHLTKGSDNFGSQILERLRDMGIPCVVFSSSIKSPEDAQIYENQYGVVGVIGKRWERRIGGPRPLQQLREGVKKMISISIEQFRERVRAKIKLEMERRYDEIGLERRRSEELVWEMQRVAGKSAANKLATSEAARIDQLIIDEKNLQDAFECEIKVAKTREDIERLQTKIMQRIGIL